MSSRALRKLGKTSIEDELATISGVDRSQSPENEDEVDMYPKKPAQNAFALLEGQEDDEDNDEDVEVIQPVVSEPVQRTAKKASKKKGKKAKSKSKKGGKTVDEMDEKELDRLLSSVSIREDDEEDDLEFKDADEPLDGPSFEYEIGGPLLTVNRFLDCIDLLKVNSRDLDPDREYEAVFGKLSDAAIDEADSTTSSFVTPEILEQIKKLRKRVRGWGGRDRRSVPGTTRKLVLTKVRDDWIPTPKRPLVMEEMSTPQLEDLAEAKFKQGPMTEEIGREKKAGIKYFRLVPGPLYSRILTTEFFLSVAVQPDHESVIRLLQGAPYHLESILQVASILQRQGDNSNTNGLIERALFIFDWSLRPSFELGSGRSRLPFAFYLNRQVYLTIFRYITVLTKKSTFYTALNYCKLLLSFEPADDPYGVRYFIDFYGFMAGEYQYVLDLYNSPLVQCYEEWLTPSLCFTAACAQYELDKSKEKATMMLLDAAHRHPYTAQQILDKLGTQGNYKAEPSRTEVVAAAIYTARLGALLEENELRGWVVDTLSSANLSGDDQTYFHSLKDVPNNLLRHVVLSGESSAMARIPESFWNQDVYEFDVLPPEYGTKIYDYIDQNKIAEGLMQRTALEADQMM